MGWASRLGPGINAVMGSLLGQPGHSFTQTGYQWITFDSTADCMLLLGAHGGPF